MSDAISTALKQHGKTKRQGHRTLLIAGAGVLLLFVYMRHRSSATAPAAVPAATDPAALPAGSTGGSTTDPGASTFADNGAQAGALGDAVTNSLAGVQTSIDAQTGAFNDLTGQLVSLGSTPANTPSGAIGSPAPLPAAAPAAPAPYVWDPAAAFAYVAAHPTPATSPPPSVKVNTQAGNPRQGQPYKTVAVKGGVDHIYANGKKIFVKK